MFRLELLPAGKGDALLIAYGDPARPHRVLVDLGFASTHAFLRPRLARIAAEEGACHFELLVVTHVDADHIEGALTLLGHQPEVTFGDIWFNGAKHLPGAADVEAEWLGGHHGAYFETLLGLGGPDRPWNAAFDGRPVIVPPTGPLPTRTLAGGLKLTLLSPTFDTLRRLATTWNRDLRAQGLVGADVDALLAKMAGRRYLDPDLLGDAAAADPELAAWAADEDLLGRVKPSGPLPDDLAPLLAAPESRDPSAPNGSSIALLAEHGGKRALLAGDAHHDVLIAALDRLSPGAPLPVHAVKLPHHASRNNVSEALLERLDSRVFLVSTDGAGHYHPDREAIARVVAGRWRAGRPGTVELVFNYASDFTRPWDRADLAARHDYRAYYPGPDPGLAIELTDVDDPPSWPVATTPGGA